MRTGTENIYVETRPNCCRYCFQTRFGQLVSVRTVTSWDWYEITHS